MMRKLGEIYEELILDIGRWNVQVCEACEKGSKRRELYVHPGFLSGSTLQNCKQSVEGDWVWNFGRARRLEFKGWNTGAEGAAW